MIRSGKIILTKFPESDQVAFRGFLTTTDQQEVVAQPRHWLTAPRTFIARRNTLRASTAARAPTSAQRAVLERAAGAVVPLLDLDYTFPRAGAAFCCYLAPRGPHPPPCLGLGQDTSISPQRHQGHNFDSTIQQIATARTQKHWKSKMYV